MTDTLKGAVLVPREVLEAATAEARTRFPEYATNPDHGRAANGYQQGWLECYRRQNLPAPAATSISGGADADVIPASALYWKRCADAAMHDSERAFCANEAYNHLRNHVYALAASPASVTSPQKPPVELEDLLSAYADLAANHDDALPISAKVYADGLIELYHNDGTPIEASQRLADFVAAACNAVGAGFVAGMKAFAAGESMPAASVTSPVEPQDAFKAKVIEVLAARRAGAHKLFLEELEVNGADGPIAGAEAGDEISKIAQALGLTLPAGKEAKSE